MVNTIFILDEYYKTQKILSVNGANTFFDDLYTLDLSTGVESYEFCTNVDDITESNYIMFYYHDQYKLFQISEIEQEHEDGKIITYCYSESACLELLNGAVRAFSGEFNCIAFFQHVLQGTSWSIGNYSSTLANKVMNINVDKTTQIWACIQNHMSVFGYELNTRVIYENGHVKHKLIDILIEGEIGNKTYKRFEYSRNAKGITKKKDLYEWCTALIIKSEKDITDIAYNVGGYYKEKGSDVILATLENERYNLGRNYIYASYEDDSSSGAEAVEKAAAELRRRAIPKFDYECDTVLTYKEYEDISIGDTVYVIDHSFDPIITLEARVGKLELSFTDRTNCKCNLTNYKEIKSKIDVTLFGGIKDIINSYFPLDGGKIAGQAINPNHLREEVYELIRTDYIKAEIGEFGKLVAETFVAQKAYVEDLNVINANIENLVAEDARIDNLVATKATIEDLTATNANIKILDAEIADIQTLVNGNLTSENIQSLNLTSKNTTIENALIKDAMIDTVSANKINTGTLNTNNVIIQSEDGGISIADETMQFKDKNDKVRIQIGRDSNDDFTFVLYDESGQGQLINANGIQSSDAIADGLIRNDHVSDNANISGSKLDINSVINVINDNGTATLKGSKIKLDDQNQTLDIAFNSITSKVDDNTEAIGDNASAINTQSTQLSVQQGQISTLITNTTIDGETLKDKYLTTSATVDGLVTKVGSLETNYKATLKTSSVQYYLSTSKTELAGGSWSDTAPAWTSGKYMWQRMKYTYTDGTTTYSSGTCVAGAVGATGEKGQSLVSSTPQWYLSTSNTTQTGGSWSTTMPAIADNKYLWLRYKLDWENPTATTYSTPTLEQVAESVKIVSSKQSALEQDLDGFKTTVSSTYQTKDDMKNYSTTTLMNSAINQKADAITQSVASTYQTKEAMKNYSTTTQMNSAIDQKADSITSSIAKTYQTIDGMKNYSTTTAMNTAINQKADSITSSVASTYQTKDAMKNYSTTTQMNTAIDQKADSITSTVSKTYQTKDAMKDYSTTTQMNSAIKQSADSVTTTITNKGYQTSSQVQQKIDNWAASFSVDKVNTGIVTLNANGVTVSHTNKSTKTQMSADGFYCSKSDGTKQYGIENGVFYAYSDTGTQVAQLGRSKWSGTNKFLTSVTATYNHTVGLSCAETSGGDPVCYVIIAGKTEEVQSGKYMYKGANLGTTTVYTPMFFRTTLSDTTATSVLSYVRALSNANRTFALMGEYQVALGCVCNNTYSFMIDGSTGSNIAHCYSPINMHGYSLADASMTMALDAQSPTTYSLKGKAPEQFVHNSYCTTEGELRHTCRETMHTTEEYDYNDTGEFVSTGRYVCYCELPLFMAENIELDYHVSISKLSFGDYRIVERTPYYFVLESEKDNFAFTYEIVAKQIEKASAANSIIANDGMFAGDSETGEGMSAPEEIH